MYKKLLFSIIAVAFVGGIFTVAYFGSNLIQTTDYSCIDCNILLISIDTLRAENLGAYGYVHETSPNLSKLAKDGILFTNAYSQIPFTPPSHWSMLSGLRPYHHQQFSPSANGSDVVTLPEIFSDNGYQTYGIISAKILSGINDEFDDFTHVKIRKHLTIGEAATEKAVTILEENQNSKFFLFLHYFDTHAPYTPPEDYDIYDSTDGSYDEVAKKISKKMINLADMAAYDGEILYNDDHVRIVMDKLEELRLAENTIVIVTSDHGECFGDRVVTNGERALQSYCMKHGFSLLEKELHVPLIVYNPKSDLKDIVIDDVVESVDIFPTILAMVGIGYDSEIDGESLVGLFTGGDRKKHFAISQLSGGFKRTPENTHFSIIIDDSKLVIQKVYDSITEITGPENWNKESAFLEMKIPNEQSLNYTINKELYKLTEYETLVPINENIKILEKLENIFHAELDGRTIDEIEEESTFTESDEDILKRFGYIG